MTNAFFYYCLLYFRSFFTKRCSIIFLFTCEIFVTLNSFAIEKSNENYTKTLEEITLPKKMRFLDESTMSQTVEHERCNYSGDAVDTSKDVGIGPKKTRFSYELNHLPDQDGQFWIVYDISQYTSQFPNLLEPQNTIIDWILFDSGERIWHRDPFCILSASRERLYVYHNEKVQRYISNIVDRFIDQERKNIIFSINLIAVQSPAWRVRYAKSLTPTVVTIEGQGADVQGWLLQYDKIIEIFSELEKRSDYVLLNKDTSNVPNGSTFGWTVATPQKRFFRDYRPNTSLATGYSADVSTVDEGYCLEVTPLLSISGDTLEVLFHYIATVIERSRSFDVRIPTATMPRQQLEVERPEIVSCDITGKISITKSMSAIIDLGMVPLSLTKKVEPSKGLVDRVTELATSNSPFYNVLIFISRTD